ncbi:hypothetical protein [Bradyrhizobium sp.]|uniref:hypothetical protein n=1 Tax=Bradyrhizobium sp. TaxID=376 RepID=UPI004037F317
MISMTRRHALLVAAGLGASLGASRGGNPGASRMQALDFERARISWTTKAGIGGSWRVIATACQQEAEDCIYLAPAVMAGNIFGADRLPLDPPYSYQLIARRERHAIVREDVSSGSRDSEADHEAAFSSFDIHAPRHAAKPIETRALDSGTVARSWPISARLKARGHRGELWNLEFPVNHINTRTKDASEFQVESGPVLIPRDIVDIADASIVGGCYLAYVFFNKTSQVDLLAWGPTSNSRRGFVRFARIVGIETELLSRQPER